jgi:hypothetical protein
MSATSTPLHAYGVDDDAGAQSQSCSRRGSLQSNATGSLLASSEAFEFTGFSISEDGRRLFDTRAWDSNNGPALVLLAGKWEKFDGLMGELMDAIPLTAEEAESLIAERILSVQSSDSSAT